MHFFFVLIFFFSSGTMSLLILRNVLLQRSHVHSSRTLKTSYKISQPQYHSYLSIWKQKTQPRFTTSSSWAFRTNMSPSRYKILLRQEQRQRQEETLTTKSKTGQVKGFMKKYGTVGVGVYLGLSVIDLTLTMALISYKGADKVKNMEDWALRKIKGWIGMKHKSEEVEKEEMEKVQHEKASFTTLFVIAYGVHKTILLPVRLSLTAAITPLVARKLRELGWIRKIVK